MQSQTRIYIITLTIYLIITFLFLCNYQSGRTVSSAEVSAYAAKKSSGDGRVSVLTPVPRRFTIEKTETNTVAETVTLHFSGPVTLDDVRNNIQIIPPVQIYWYQSSLENNTAVKLKGKFQAGQSYFIKFSPEFMSTDEIPYTSTITTVALPDYDPALKLGYQGTVVELNSRQLLHTRLLNVTEILLHTVRVPVVLLPQAIAEEDRNGVNIEEVYKRFTRNLRQLVEITAGYPEFFHAVTPVQRQSQLFFNQAEKNEEHAFSIPMTFRESSDTGGIYLVEACNNTTPDTVTSKPCLYRITDLALTYKQSPDELFIWATSIYSGMPVEGVQVFLFTEDMRMYPVGETDINGIITVSNRHEFLNLSMKSFDEPFIVKSELDLSKITCMAGCTDTDQTFIKLAAAGTVNPEGITQVKRTDTSGRLIKGHIFTERGIYRPGDTVHFKGTLREYAGRKIFPPDDYTCYYRIKNPKNEIVASGDYVLSEFGTFHGEFITKSFFPLGKYTITVYNQNHKTEHAQATFQVEEYRPPRHYVDIKVEEKEKESSDYINLIRTEHYIECGIQGKYYSGGPVKHGKVRWKMYLTGASFMHEDYPDYEFGLPVGGSKRLLETGESVLDESGAVTVNVPVGKDVLGGLSGLEIVGSVVDFDGRVSSTVSTYQHRPEYLIGVKKHDENVNISDKQSLDIIVLGPYGRTIKRGNLDVEIMGRQWTYLQKRNVRGEIYWESQKIWKKLFAGQIPVRNGKSTFDFDFAWGGQYQIRFTYTLDNGQFYTGGTIYNVSGYYYDYRYIETSKPHEKITLTPDKSVYGSDGKIILRINPKQPVSRCLLTIERDSVLEYRLVELDSMVRSIELPVKPEYFPNVYISVLGIQGRGDFPVYTGQEDNSAPAFLYGYTNIQIRETVNSIDIAVNSNEKVLTALPGTKFKLDITATDINGNGVASELAVGIVDESVLSLTGYATPKLDTILRFTYPLSVYTGELYKDLQNQTPFGKVRNEVLTGGGGAAGKDISTPKTRKQFNPVAYFNPAILTDEKGHAGIECMLPDTMTQYRIYVVACDKTDKIGSVDREVTVTKPFYLEPGLPRFFTRGDKGQFAVSVFNKTGKTGPFHFSGSSNGQLDLQIGKLTYPMKPFDRYLVPVQVEAVQPGETTLLFSGSFEELADAVELKLPVNSALIRDRDVRFGTFRNSATIAYTFPPGTEKIHWQDIHPQDLKAKLTVSGSPFIRLEPGLKYLLRYPYGCVEQTSSCLMPLVALRSLIDDGLICGISTAETEKFVEAGINRIFSMQTKSGGFGYWPGYSNPDRWASIYAVTALTTAKSAGYEIDSSRLVLALTYINNELKKDKHDTCYEGFAVYVLSMNGALDRKTWTNVMDNFDKHQQETQYLLLLSGKQQGFMTETELLAKLDTINTGIEHSPCHIFYSQYRRLAITLISLMSINPDNPRADNMAQQLIMGMNPDGRWISTKDTGWVLMALGTYFRNARFGITPTQCTVTPENAEPVSFSLTPGSYREIDLNPEMFLRHPRITIVADMDFTLLYNLELTFPRTDYIREGFSHGFTVNKSIANMNGSDTIKLGDIVKVNIKIEVPDRYYRYLALEDPLPAGLVAINSALKTEETPDEKSQYDEDEYYWYYWDPAGFYRFIPSHFEMRDDRVLVFKDYAWKGIYQYSYYARAVMSGEFIVPPTRIQLMYSPEIKAYTKQSTIIIE